MRVEMRRVRKIARERVRCAVCARNVYALAIVLCRFSIPVKIQ